MHGPRPTLNGYVRKHVDHAVDFLRGSLRRARRSTRIPRSRARSTCSATARCGSCYTPGHTLGHQSLILRLRDREALIAGDAIYFLETLEDEKRGFAMADEHLWRRSLREIQLYRRENPEALIIPGHDPEESGPARTRATSS